jgi:HEAT repeat protein
MSAAALFRLASLLLIGSSVLLGQSQSGGSAPPSEQTTKEAPARSETSDKASEKASDKAEDEQQPNSPEEPVTIPDPALAPLDGAWQLLETGIKSDKSGDRAIALRALGLLHDNARAGKMAETGAVDSKPEVRTAAAFALGKIGRKKSIAALREMLDDKDSKVVLSAAQSLIELKQDEGYEVYYEILTGERKTGSGLIASQEAMLKDPKRLLDLGFHEGLGFVPFGGISYEAFKTITKDDVSPVRAAAANKLAHDPDPATTKALINAAGDKNWLVRASALEALAIRGDSSAAKTAGLYMYDDRPEVKYTAAAAVIRLSTKEKKKVEPKQAE